MNSQTKSSFQQWFRFFASIKYGLLFVLILIGTPFSVLPNGPQHDLLGGLFTSLDRFDVFWATLGALLFSWSVMFTEGFVIDDLSGRIVDGETYVPERMQNFLNEKLSATQLAIFSALCLPTIGFICLHGEDGLTSSLVAALLAGAAALFILVASCTPARLVCPKPELQPAGIRWMESLWEKAGQLTWARNFCFKCANPPWKIFQIISDSKSFGWMFTSGVGPCSGGKAVPIKNPLAHYFAATVFTGILALGIAVACIFKPSSALPKPPALAYVYCMLILTTWAFGFFRVQLRRWDVSPLWVMLPIICISYHVLGTDHFFHATIKHNTVETDPRLTPVEAVGDKAGSIVIVTSTGGGILAAGWTTLVLHELASNRPAIINEIKLISGVSGGAVGAAFFADSLVRNPTGTNIFDKTEQAFQRSTSASLNELTYGLAMVDYPRMISGGWLPPEFFKKSREIDRGNWLEFAWQRNAAGANFDNASLVPSFYEYNKFVKKQIAPSLIFSSTVMESGERVMFCNNRFSDSWVGQTEFIRARTFEEYCLSDGANNHDGVGADVSLWTAARMSASFPWVSPAARPNFQDAVANTLGGPLASHHFVDGGYFDNYGVSSAMDWLNPVLHDRLQFDTTTLKFNKILIVQLRAYDKTSVDPAENGWNSAIFGPPICFWSVYNSAPRIRNEIALARFIENWNSRLKGHVRISTEIVQRKKIGGALSWYLSPNEIAELKTDVKQPPVQDAIKKIVQQLIAN